MAEQGRREVADRYAELPEETRDFLEDLRPQEIVLLNKAINFMRSAETMGRFFRWSAILVVGFFLGTVALRDAIVKIWGWFSGGPHP